MTKPREKTREELQAEIEDGKKKIRQFENREKMLRQKLSKEERRTRSHRLIVRGAVFESIVPEAKGMTNEKSATFLLLLCNVYLSFFQALNLNFPVIQTVKETIGVGVNEKAALSSDKNCPFVYINFDFTLVNKVASL